MKRLLWGLCMLAGCATVPIDVYPAAARAVDEGQLLRALAYLDQIPPAHQHYPDARMLAQAVERRLRRSQELLLQGLELRAQWRDAEALACFEEAQLIWTAAVGVDAWIEATRSRIRAAEVVATPAPAGEVKATQPEGHAPVDPDPIHPPTTIELGAEGDVVVGEGTPPPSPIVEMPVAGPDPSGGNSLSLVQIERLIEAGDLQTAIDELDRRVRRDASDRPARQRLVRVLHQRALQSYGRGWLEVAIADWTRLLEVEPTHQQARSFLQAASAEHDRRTASPASAPR